MTKPTIETMPGDRFAVRFWPVGNVTTEETPMNTISRRHFLRILPALPLVAFQLPGVMPTEREEPNQSDKERLLFLEKDNLWRDITVKWLVLNMKAMMKCFRGCGTMVPKQRYRA